MRIVTAGHVDITVQNVMDMRDRIFEERLGIVGGLINEMRGPNQILETLLRARKHQEGTRKDIITGVGKTTRKAFNNDGRDLTSEQSAALSAVLLRSGAHVLLDTFTLAEWFDVLWRGNRFFYLMKKDK